MRWKGIFFGAVLGLLTTRSVLGAVAGALMGHLLDENMRGGRAHGTAIGGARGAGHEQPSVPVAEVFFRTTFEMMGHVAKSDGRVSEAEIDAAQRLMHELKLSPGEINVAIAYFRAGKSARYDAQVGIERLRETCGQRYDLLLTFMELQLRAALAAA